MWLRGQLDKGLELSAVLSDVLQAIADRFGAPTNATNGGDIAQLLEMCDLLISNHGEATGAALASIVLKQIQQCDAENLDVFLNALITQFGADVDMLDQAITAYRDEPSAKSIGKLHRAAESKRQELFRRLNMAPGGTQALVKLREQVLVRLRETPELCVVNDDLIHLFSSWFNRGFLELRHIDWQTPANILEKIIQYEAVHEITDWTELRRRIQPSDRRCFAFFHPQMPEEPVIFVEVALTQNLTSEMTDLLDSERQPILAEDATTAIFYSISNCQFGLKNISFGNLLIKQVVADLQQQLPNLQVFATLSPMPKFAKWLDAELSDNAATGLSNNDVEVLSQLADPQWVDDESLAVKPALMRAAAAYFFNAKRGDGRPVDPVGRFHLGNGARLERINFLADRSTAGLKQSYGMMVNYLYDPASIEENHELYADKVEIVASKQVKKPEYTQQVEDNAA